MSDNQQTESENSQDSKPVFIKKKKKPTLRKRRLSDEESDEDQSLGEKLEERKIIQKLRQRPNGVNTLTLALGEKVPDEAAILDDPFKVKSGGLINMASLKSGKIKAGDDAYDTGIGTQFSAETNKRDEDEEMMRYIEEELSKRKGQSDKDDSEGGSKYCSPEEAALQAVPTHLRTSSAQRSEEMLSNQMLSGIPEVDLGIEAKIRNIEATEEAKLRLLWEKHNKKDGPSQFVPTNMAVNFVQHNRFNIDEAGPLKKQFKSDPIKEEVSQLKSGPGDGKKPRDGSEKATDDYHYEKFKKQFRRY